MFIFQPYSKVEEELDGGEKSEKNRKTQKIGTSFRFCQPFREPLEYFDEDALDLAKYLLDEECTSIIQVKRYSLADTHG